MPPYPHIGGEVVFLASIYTASSPRKKRDNVTWLGTPSWILAVLNFEKLGREPGWEPQVTGQLAGPDRLPIDKFSHLAQHPGMFHWNLSRLA